MQLSRYWNQQNEISEIEPLNLRGWASCWDIRGMDTMRTHLGLQGMKDKLWAL